MVEVMVSVILIAVFSIAVMTAITSGTAASADNRARITAAGLAQRELDYAAERITGSPNGANQLLDPAVNPAVNPNLPASMDTGHAVYAFGVDGQRYKVVRTASTYITEVNSPCDPSGSATQTAKGTLVTVTVSWEGASAGTRPHVASKVFPPHRNAPSALSPGQSQISVFVKGEDHSGAGPIQGVQVEVTGPQVLTGPQITNAAGCAVFTVVPASPTGSDYTVTLLGYQGGSSFVYPNGQVNPSQPAPVQPGANTSVKFEDYNEAASLTVVVPNAPESVQFVQARPLFALGGTARQASLVGGVATFTGLAPGDYSIDIGGVSKATVTLVPGPNPSKEVSL
ncbi:MAG: hypothetical protein LBC97_15300 [Bifidobacteriaceae bacterium]|nr:hypothetical protein [Bifidobacteriaceae bacterium]